MWKAADWIGLRSRGGLLKCGVESLLSCSQLEGRGKHKVLFRPVGAQRHCKVSWPEKRWLFQVTPEFGMEPMEPQNSVQKEFHLLHFQGSVLNLGSKLAGDVGDLSSGSSPKRKLRGTLTPAWTCRTIVKLCSDAYGILRAS